MGDIYDAPDPDYEGMRTKKIQPLKTKVPPKLPTYVFKLMWRATSKIIKIEAKDYFHAIKAAEKLVTKMEGGASCLDIQFLERRG